MRVLFTSEHDLGRAENLRAVYEKYDGEKDFVRGIYHMASAPDDGYDAVVCDALPAYMPNKGNCKSIIVGHGIIGKTYALDEPRSGIDKRAFPQIDAVSAPSTKTAHLVSGCFGIPSEKVHALGYPRTDSYHGKHKGDGGTFLADCKRAYLYAPTFRGSDDAGWLPNIDWAKLDAMLGYDEVMVIKRHYFDRNRNAGCGLKRVIEVDPSIGSTPYLLDCDVLMTDYSGIVVDGYLAGKPSVLVVDDMNEYMSTRGMYLDYPSQYGSRTITAEGNEESLLEMLREAAENGMGDVERAFADTAADMCDGHATERVCNLIKEMTCAC